MKTPTFRARLCVLTVACTIVSSFAQNPPPADSPRLKEIVVTASRTPTRSDELVSDVTVIERSAIELSTARTLPELLAREAGVQMTANGGMGKLSSVFIRGTASSHTILLIDGVRYGSVTAGTPIWDNIPVELIERIEVLKGPGSALYGADGAGGVVQIFTRKGQAGFRSYASLSAGSKGYNQAVLGMSGAQGSVSYSLGVQTQRQTGFSSTNANVASNQFHPDNDGFSQDAFTGSVAVQLRPNWSVDAGVMQSDGVTQVDRGATRDDRTAVRTQVTQLGLKGQVLERWQTELRLAQSLDLATAVMAPTLPERFMTTQSQVTWQNNVSTRAGAVTVGVEQLVQKVDSTTRYTVSERVIDAYFLGLNGSVGVHSWQLNTRTDKNSQFGTSHTGFVGYGLKLSDHWRVSASKGSSFVAPSFNDLYYYDASFPNSSNPNLRPSKGNNLDVSLSYSLGMHNVKLTHFDNQITDLIALDANFSPVNVGRARIQGWTLGYDSQIGKLALRVGVDDFNPRNELTHTILQRRAEKQLTVGADYDFGSWRLGSSLLAVGERFNDADNKTRLPGYATVDVYASMNLTKDWQLQAKINNLNNKVYETVYGYNQPKRAGVLTLKYTPK